MEFIVPEFKHKENPIGLYRIWFDEKWFYIGSSVRSRSRFSTWRANLRSGKFKSLNIRKILPEVTTIRFEIIQTYKSASWLRRNETKEINKHWDNPLFLNRCPDANSPKNMRPYFGYIKPVKVLKGTPEYMKPIRVALFKKTGEFIKIFNSRTQLQIETKIKTDTINRIMDGKRGQPRNFILKKVLETGEIIEPPVFSKSIYDGKKILKCDKNGVVVDEYISIMAASRSVGGTKSGRRNIQTVLYGKGPLWTYKGYIWKYA